MDDLTRRPERPYEERPDHERTKWAPFGPSDNSRLDARTADSIVATAQKMRERLLAARVDALTKLRGPKPEPPPDPHKDKPQDRPHDPPPDVPESTRADSFWPFLLIRGELGDFGARPAILQDFSPDILFTEPGPANEPELMGRKQFAMKTAAATDQGKPCDVWVHVWNLGRAPAYGVRVRAWARGPWDQLPGKFLGGKRFDLGDRESDTSHLIVKIGSWVPQQESYLNLPLGFYIPGRIAVTWIYATAECITDVANGSLISGEDRHTAIRMVWHQSLGPT